MIYKGSIKKRLILIIMSVTFLTGLFGYGAFVYWYMNDQHKRAINLSKTVALVLGQDIAKLILLNDVSVAADISSSLKSFSNLDSMVLYKLDGKPILQYSKKNKSFIADKLPKDIHNASTSLNNSILKLYIQAKYNGTKLGYVQLKFKIDTIFDVIKRNIPILFIIFAFMFIISYLLAIFFAKKFTDPILKLVNFLETVDITDSSKKRIYTNERNEYGKLYEEVNVMLQRFEDVHEVMKVAAVAFETQNGITITDKDHKILQVNNAFTKITGYKPEEVIGQTPRILQSGIHGKDFYDEMKESLITRNIWIGEINNRHKDGSIVNEHLTIHTVLGNSGEPLYYVASFLDITLLKETEAKLKEKEGLLIQKSKMAAMGEMIENIAHQWKQPLSIISTAASGIIIKKEMQLPIEEKEEVEKLNKINETVQYLSHTIDDFRDFFKPDKKKNTFLLKACYRRVLNLVNSKLKSLSVEVVENLDDVEVKTLENELIQVMMNILSNARDILQESNSIQKRYIFVNIYQDEQNAYLSIKDNGGGVPKEIINRVFDPYFTTKDEKGTGIGLNMSKEMVEKHMDGKLTVENSEFTYKNENYKGANFIITLPL